MNSSYYNKTTTNPWNNVMLNVYKSEQKKIYKIQLHLNVSYIFL